MSQTPDFSAYPNPHGPGCPWHHAAETFGAPNIKWCEETVCAWISEPANAWSNLAFLIVAILIWRAGRDGFTRSFSVCVALIGLCSFVYHMSNNLLSQVLDFVGMYLLFGLLFAHYLRSLAIWPNLPRVPFIAGFVALFTALLVGMYFLRLPYQAIIGILVVVTIGGETAVYRLRGGSLRLLLTAVITMGFAALATLFDRLRIFCFPGNHIFQAHALWHVLAAVAIYFLFRYQQSQRSTP